MPPDPHPDAPPLLADDHVQAWWFRLDPEPHVVSQLAELLSPAERERAQRFSHPEDQRRALVSHGRLRQLLSAALGRDPRQFRFVQGPQGKPRLDDDGCHFNLSHSADRLLIALAPHTPVGADIERERPLGNLEGLAARYFAHEETQALLALPADRRPGAFFRVWTRKEALVKAFGLGLQFPLDAFAVSLAEHSADLRWLDAAVTPPAPWRLFPLAPEAEFWGAVAVPASVRGLSLHDGDRDGTSLPTP